MPVDDPSTIDAIGVDSEGVTVLTVSDHVDWVEPRSHLESLQSKLNAYLAFLESGEVYHVYPASVGRSARIEVVFRCDPAPEGLRYLRKAHRAISKAGFTLAWRTFKEPS